MKRNRPLTTEGGPGTGIAAGALVLALAIQIVLFRITAFFVAAAVFTGVAVVAPTLGLSVRKTLATIRGFLILLAPVLALQLIIEGVSLPVFREWGTYALRLIAAALVARVYYSVAGVAGIEAGIEPFLRIVPRRVAEPFRLILTGSLFLLPRVLIDLRDTIRAGRLRFRSGDRSYRWHNWRIGELVTVYPKVFRAAVLNVLRIPDQRAAYDHRRGVLTGPLPDERTRSRTGELR